MRDTCETDAGLSPLPERMNKQLLSAALQANDWLRQTERSQCTGEQGKSIKKLTAHLISVLEYYFKKNSLRNEVTQSWWTGMPVSFRLAELFSAQLISSKLKRKWGPFAKHSISVSHFSAADSSFYFICASSYFLIVTVTGKSKKLMSVVSYKT